MRIVRTWVWAVCWVCFVAGWAGRGHAAPLHLDLAQPSLDRWMYPFNFEPGIRTVAPTYASFDYRFDTRDAQFLIGWDTAAWVPTNRTPARYLLRQVRLTLTVVGNLTFLYDPTYDSYRTYATNSPDYTPDTDAGRPIELYGAGFRSVTAATFAENGLFGPLNPITSGNISIGTRSVYAASFDATGNLLDVANNVGQSNVAWTNAPFDPVPWAIGITTGANPGEFVPSDSQFVFNVNLSDRYVRRYLQAGLDEGRLRLVVSSLSPATQITPGGTGGGGAGSYPQWATKENVLYDAPRLEIEGVLVSDTDTDADGLPDDWEQFYFGSLSAVTAGDPDGDEAANLAEFQRGTDPLQADPPPATVKDLAVIRVAEDGTVTLRFGSDPALRHRVELSFDLNTWREATGEFSSPGPATVEWRETDPTVPPAGRSRAFYRVAIP